MLWCVVLSLIVFPGKDKNAITFYNVLEPLNCLTLLWATAVSRDLDLQLFSGSVIPTETLRLKICLE